MKQNFPIIDKMLTVTLFSFAVSSMFSISISQVSAGIGGFLWLARTRLSKAWGEQRWPLGIPVLLFALASLLAVADAYDVSHSYKSLKKNIRVSNFFLGVKLCPRKQPKRLSIASPYSLCDTCRLVWVVSILARSRTNNQHRIFEST